MRFLASNHFDFPDPSQADEQGLLAIGGDLTAERLLTAYRMGIFPWFEPDCLPLWWSPNPRLILKPTHFKLSRSLKQSLKKPHHFSIDCAFSEVIAACASSPGRINHTWITDEMQTAYNLLHDLGYAHSFEIWQDDQLSGGLYGISMGKAFFGESMFHRTRDSSKMAMYYLCATLQAWDFHFIDCQLPTEHLLSLGAEIISRSEFLKLLKSALEFPTRQGRWTT
ncbi:leucyl/phenylalanyl-tRNA--protein transferase [Legionella jordanis]|uniref:leucyl/phenylalanyl-tRNA--protein transferase n=1 Tax=Legionella jordanis TaxID=456 RepID=UPI0007311F01|nr:leucyl/phenylalanyl-tRNA--protein transferase [Legionella jordanis]RMX03972.1 leucyl/phenylalanyl-tRNA--protein transferase [Legionella jordanis]HAT8712639.1 leucyl/phenylalanyl-tRNA--protein transferase [Legionella jordanis]